MMVELSQKDITLITIFLNFIVTRTIITSTGNHHDTESQTLKNRISITGLMYIRMEHLNLKLLEVYV